MSTGSERVKAYFEKKYPNYKAKLILPSDLSGFVVGLGGDPSGMTQTEMNDYILANT